MDHTICRLCLTKTEKCFDVFDEEGVLLNAQSIIEQHFWFPIDKTDEYSKNVCLFCWETVEHFHIFYKKIENLHRTATSYNLSTEYNIKSEIDFVDIKNETVIEPESIFNDVQKAEKEATYSSKKIQLRGYVTSETEEKSEMEVINPKIKRYSTVVAKTYYSDGSTDQDSLEFTSESDEESEQERKQKRKKYTSIVSSKKNNDPDFQLNDKEKKSKLKRKSISEKTVEDLEKEATLCKKSQTTTESAVQDSSTSESDLESEQEKKQKKRSKTKNIDPDFQFNDKEKKSRLKRKPIPEKSAEDLEKEAAFRKKFQTETDQIREFCKMECELCAEKFKDFANVLIHYRKAHKTKGYLKCCSQKLWTRTLALQHIIKHIDPEKFKCEVCGKTFIRKKNLSIHMDNFHVPKTLTYQCDECPAIFFTSCSLQTHKKKHKPKSFLCPECGKGFISNADVLRHIRLDHKCEEMGICDICARTFKTKSSYNNHRLYVHGSVEQVQCPICGVQLKNEHGLKSHMIIHQTSDEKYICNICGKQSVNKRALGKHIRFMHKIQRSFACGLCDKSFKRALALKEHMAMHTGEVLYTCKFCPRTFNSSANMHGHQKKMHPVEWAEDKAQKN